MGGVGAYPAGGAYQGGAYYPVAGGGGGSSVGYGGNSLGYSVGNYGGGAHAGGVGGASGALGAYPSPSYPPPIGTPAAVGYPAPAPGYPAAPVAAPGAFPPGYPAGYPGGYPAAGAVAQPAGYGDPFYGGGPGAAGSRPFSSRCDDGDAFRQVGARLRARRQYIRRFVSVPSLPLCERECADARDFVCRSFNFRWVRVPSSLLLAFL